MMMPQCVQYGTGQPQMSTAGTAQCLSACVTPQGAASWGQVMPPSSLPFVASSGALVSQSQPGNEAQDKQLCSQQVSHSKPENMIHSHSAASLSTTASSGGSESGSGSSRLSRKPSYHWLHRSQLDSTEDSLVPASDSATLELQRTSRAQAQVRRWLSTAMNEKITCLEKELDSRANLDRKNKEEMDTLDRQRSHAKMSRLQNMEKRHQRQHDVYEEAQRIAEDRRRQALEKVQRWDEQVCAVQCDKEHNHQIRKDIQRVANRAMESLNDKIYEQRVHSKIKTEELRDHMTRCLSHEVFDPISVEHSKDRMVSSPRALYSSRSTHSLHSSRSQQALHSPRFEHVAPTPRLAGRPPPPVKARAKSPQYRYRSIDRSLDQYRSID